MSIMLVMVGGLFGAAARQVVSQALPTPSRGFPASTFVVNVSGAFVLGLLLEALIRCGDDSGWRRHARLVAGTGFCGAFTTMSSLAVEAVQLGRHGDLAMASVYVLASVAGGLVAAATGIGAGAVHARWTTADLPVDPDVDRDRRRS